MRCSVPWMTLILAAFVLAVAAFGLEPRLQLRPLAVAASEPWRLWSGHFTHWNLDHLAWDLAAFVVLSAACEHRDRTATATLFAIGSVAVSMWLADETGAYRGLSALDSGLFLLLAFLMGESAWRERRLPVLVGLAIVTVGFLGKCVYESIAGATLFVDHRQANFTPLVSAHLAGAAIGIAAYACGKFAGHCRAATWFSCQRREASGAI